MIAAAVAMGVLGLAIGAGLAAGRLRFKTDAGGLLDAIDVLLPQIQCAQCGYPGCRPYAEAILNGAALDLCPPGGQATASELAALLGRQKENPTVAAAVDQVAVIDESACIGCALCLDACPVDAIVGANKYLHTVIADRCTGCELCIAPCPVDCIELAAVERKAWSWPRP